MRRRGRGVSVAAATLLAALVLPPAVSQADSHKPTVEQQERKAERLKDKAERLAGDIAAGRDELEQLTTQAHAALDTYQQALDRRRIANERSAAAQAELAEADLALREAQDSFDTYIVLSFQAGGTSGGLAGAASLLDSGDPARLAEELTLLSQVNQFHAGIVDEMEAAERRQQEAARLAEQAEAEAAQAEETARAAKERADALVARQDALIRSQEEERQRTLSSAERLQEAAERTRRAQEARRRALEEAKERQRIRALEDQARREAAASGGSAGGSSGGTCTGGNLDGYANGFLPTSALCPLWGAGGHALRADAAAAFNALSKEYAAAFGRPICVTDSYRSYAEQVDVKRRKPTLAATPGTSNHGWGRAVDLCDGVQTGGTVTHNWMRVNGPRYGWFNPGWAQAGGSGPYEPWHWEFAG